MSSLHPREQIPETCPSCGHKVIEVTERPDLPPGRMATDNFWAMTHAEPSDCACDCNEVLCLAAERGHPTHKCLACNGPIYGHEPEIKVPSRRGWGPRYRHADDDGCRRTMSRSYGSRIVSGGLVGRGR